MADSNTTLYKLVKPEVGASADTWGSKTNADWDSVDKLLGAIATAGSANAYTLTTGQSLSAYAIGQTFRIIPNFSNTGGCTLNVDGLGGKSLYKNVGGTPTSANTAGDIASGVPITVTYDGTHFIVSGALSGVYQPLDATLTALAALSWSSGNALLQFTAADTVSLTLTPSVTSITANRGAGASSVAASLTNSTDSSGVIVANIAGARATPAANDLLFIDWYLNNASSAATRFGRMAIQASAVTAGAETGLWSWFLTNAGSNLEIARLMTTAFAPAANDRIALGTTSLSFSDLFLASGGVINWNSGDFTLTHSSGKLTASGRVSAATMDGGLVKSSEASGTLTSASANTYLDLTGGITMPNAVFSAGQWQFLVAGSASRTITRGASIAMYVNGTNSSSATLSARGTALAFWDDASTLYLSGDVA